MKMEIKEEKVIKYEDGKKRETIKDKDGNTLRKMVQRKK